MIEGEDEFDRYTTGSHSTTIDRGRNVASGLVSYTPLSLTPSARGKGISSARPAS